MDPQNFKLITKDNYDNKKSNINESINFTNNRKKQLEEFEKLKSIINGC